MAMLARLHKLWE